MDTGLLYRAVALKMWRWGGDPDNEFEALRACDELGFDPDDEELRSEPVSRIASKISSYASVRDALIQRQRDFAARRAEQCSTAGISVRSLRLRRTSSCS